MKVTVPSRDMKSRSNIRLLNEMEYVNGKLMVNVWGQDVILIVNPDNGYVEQIIQLSHVSKLAYSNITPSRDSVLNGIAFEPESKRLFISGKLWANVYEVSMPDI